MWCGDNPEAVRQRAQKVEKPGPYFAGPVGVLIPAAGRLLLAIAERLATDRGISHVFCDTDSMCFSRPDGMGFPTFSRKVREIVDWFTPLSPYRAPGSILQIEIGRKEMTLPDDSKIETDDPGWLCFAISAKRYAIFRLGDPLQGEPRIASKKISSHGMGAIRDPKDYRSIFPDAPPREEIEQLVTSKAAVLIIYDIWREAIEAVLDGKETPQVREWLEPYPFFHPERIGNSHEMELYKAVDHAWPFSFGSFVPRFVGFADPNGISEQRLKELGGPFLGKHAASFDEIKDDLFNRETGERANMAEAEAAGLHPQTLAGVLATYFDHPEAKAANPDGIGVLQRREVVITGRRYIGKETPAIDEDFNDDELTEFHKGRVVVGSKERKPRVKPDPALVERMRRCLPSELARTTGISKKVIIRWRNGERGVPPDRLPDVVNALNTLEGRRETKNQHAAQLRGRINALADTEDGSGWSRVKRIATGRGMTVNRYKAITLRDQLPTPAEAALLMKIVVQCEREDCPVGTIEVAGVIDRVIWPRRVEDRVQANGRAIFTIAAESFADPVTVLGMLPVAGARLPVEVAGEWRYDDEHGPQIEAASITVTLPETEPEIKAYLASGVVPGIGPTTAFRLIHRFGVDVFTVAADQPERLAEVKWLAKDAAEALMKIAREPQGWKDIHRA